MRHATIAALIGPALIALALPGVANATSFYGGLDDGTTSTYDDSGAPISIATPFGSASSSLDAVALQMTMPRTPGNDRGGLYWTGNAGLDTSFEVQSVPATGNGMLTMKFAVSGYSAHNGRFDVAESSSELDWHVSLSGPAGSFDWYGSKWSYANGDNYQTSDGSNDDYSIVKNRQHAFGTYLIQVPLAAGTYYVQRDISCSLGSAGIGGARCKATITALPPLVMGLAGPSLQASITRVGGVPEPGTWVLMIAGFGLAGVALRRRGLPAAA